MTGTHRLRLPLDAAQVDVLHAGDLVELDGEIVITAGLPTHQRLVAELEAGRELPLDLHGAALFHLGSFSQDNAAGGFDVRYMNPTTSTRFNPFMPTLIRTLGLRAVGGKGGLDQACVEAMQEVGCVYLSFLGGGATLLTRAIREVVAVEWNDLIAHYRLVRLRVAGLGPLTVGIDAHGRSLYADLAANARTRLPDIMATLRAAARATDNG
jgi:fumarate hydratase subunit beta